MKRFFEEYGAVVLAAIATTIIIGIIFLVGGRIQTGTGSIFNSFVNSSKDVETSYVYRVEYASTSGKELGVDTVTGVAGTTKEVKPAAKVGYTSPSSQTITWDSERKTIKFVYTPINYSITYDVANGTHSNPTNYNIESPDIVIKAPTRTGFNFAGWTSEDIIQPTIDYTIKTGSHGNKKLVANWATQAVKYNIAYESSSGKVLGTDTITKEFGTSNTIAAPEKVGYVTPKPQTVEWDSPSAKTIKFIYTPIEYKINYSLNGGTLGSNPVSSYTVESANIKIATPTKNGHVFLGWSGSNGSNPQKDVLITSGSTGDKNYTANWSTNSYKLTFDVNGGSALPETTKTIKFGEPYGTLPTPVRAEYEFLGWFTQRTGGAKVTEKTTAGAENKTIYAQWKLKEYQAFFNGNGGSDGETITKGYNLSLGQLPTSTRPGYTFTGWFTQKTGGQKISSTTKMPSGGATYYAQWSASQVKYKVTHQIMNVDGTNYTDQEVENLSAKANERVTPQVKVYKGFTAPQTQTVTIDPNGTTHVTYKYARNRYNFVPNNVVGFTYDQSSAKANEYYYESNIHLKGQAQNGYTFIGWNVTGSNELNLGNKPDVTFKMPALNSTLDRLVIAPKVAMQSYSIVYDLGGGNVTGNPSSYNVETETITLKAPTKAGHTFLGWTGSNGQTPQKTVTIPKGSYGNKSYKANWQVNTYTLTYNANGGNVSPTSKPITYGQPYGTLPTPTKTGFNFVGWFTSATGGTKVTESTIIKGNTTIYAQWSANKRSVTVNYVFENGKEASNQVYAMFDYGKPYSIPSPSLTGYTPDKAVVSGTMGADDVVVTVTYRPNTYTYKVIFRSSTGKVLEQKDLSGKFGTSQTVTPTDKTGYITPKAQTVTFDSVNPKTIEFAYNIINRRVNFVTLNTTNVNPQQFNVETSAVTLPTTTKTGYKFNGWVLEQGLIRKDLEVTSNSCSGTKKEFTIDKPQVLIGHINNQAERTAAVYIDNKANGQTVANNYGNYLVANLPAGTYEITAALGSCSDAGAIQLFDVVLVNQSYITTFKGTDYNKDITVYASWTPNNYTYNINYVSTSGKSLGTATVTGAFDSFKEVVPPAKTGYTTPAKQTVRFDSTSAKTITFTYAPISYSIGYNLNGGSVSGNPTSYNVESEAITLKNPTRTGYTFTGWTGSNGNTPQTNVTIPTGTTGNKTYTAILAVNTYTLTYNANGGSVTPTSKSLSYGSQYGSLPTPTRAGYTFNGWYTAATGGSKVSSTTTMGAGNTTIYAQWTIKTVTNTINYVSSSGKSLGSTTISGNYGSSKTFNAPAKTGYTTPAAQTIKFDNTSGKTVSITYNLINYKINLSLYEGTLSSGTSLTYNVESGNVKLPTPTKANNNFLGWTTDVTGTDRSDLNFESRDCNETTRTLTLSKEMILGLTINNYSERSAVFDLSNSDGVAAISKQSGDIFIDLKPGTYTLSAYLGSCSDYGSIRITNARLYNPEKLTTLNTTGKTGDIQLRAIWQPKEVVNTINFKGSDGRLLGTKTITGYDGGFMNYFPPNFSGYKTPGSQSLKFTYGSPQTYDFIYQKEITYQLVDGSTINTKLREIDSIKPIKSVEFVDTAKPTSGVISIEGLDKDNDNGVVGWYTVDSNNNSKVFISTQKPGQKVIANTNSSYMFNGYGSNNAYRLNKVETIDVTKLDTSNVTNMSYVFNYVGYNATTFNIIGLNQWNTSKVVSMRTMFQCAGYNATTWNIGDLSQWNVSNVTDMAYMFGHTGFNTKTAYNIGNLNNWNTTKVTDMSSMFSTSGWQASTWNIGDLSRWDVSNVKNMESMFASCAQNAETWNIGNLSDWNVSNVKNMSKMFASSGRGSKSWNVGNLSSWNVGNVTNMNGMFNHAGYGATTWNIGDLSSWDVSNVTDMAYMFNNTGNKAATWDIGNLSSWNVSNVTDMAYMFFNTNVRRLDLSSWNVSKVTKLNYMFSQCKKLESLGNLDNWDISNVTTLDHTFDQCYVLKDIGSLKNWNTSNVTSMFATFYNNKELVSLDLTNWNTSKVTSTRSMFSGENYKLVSLGDLSKWDMSNVLDMGYMFRLCKNLNNIGDISNWNVSNVTNMAGTFTFMGYDSKVFTLGNLSKWNTQSATNMNNMFNAAFWQANYSLNLSNWNVNKVTNYTDFNIYNTNHIVAPRWVH